jgi:glutaryl-CoA dehydrogenase
MDQEREVVCRAGRLRDEAKLEPAHVSMLNRNNVAMALECARLSRDLRSLSE